MTFEAVIDKVGALKSIVDILSTVLEETCNFMVDTKRFYLLAMDPSHVSMINFELPKASFKEFKCDKKTKIGLNIGNLNKLLKRVGANTELKMKLSDKENKLILQFKDKNTRTFSLNLVDLEEEEFPDPKMQFNSKVILENPTTFTEAIKDAELFSDHLKLEVDSNNFTIFASGDNGEVKIEIPKEREELTLEVKEKSESMYPTQYLSQILKLASVSYKLTIEFSTEMPMQMLFELKPKENPIGSCSYFLAPRVEEETEETEDATTSESEKTKDDTPKEEAKVKEAPKEKTKTKTEKKPKKEEKEDKKPKEEEKAEAETNNVKEEPIKEELEDDGLEEADL